MRHTRLNEMTKTIDSLLTASEESLTASYVVDECLELCIMLLKKNAAYGDSAINPLRLFSQVNPVEQIKVRIDDKLSRLMRGHAMDDESLNDTVQDLLGYLILLRVAMNKEA